MNTIKLIGLSFVGLLWVFGTELIPGFSDSTWIRINAVFIFVILNMLISMDSRIK